MKRISYDTVIKHITRHGLLKDILTPEEIALIPSSNISRWKNEADEKYHFCEINNVIKQEIKLIKRLNQSSRIKKINQSYFILADAFHQIISKIKGIKSLVNDEKELVVNTIEKVRSHLPVNTALKVFNISRSTFEKYKSILIYKCESSYFNWCAKRFPNQLLPKEVQVIKTYMEDQDYKFWSKSSIYLKALRDKKLQCGISTFYKYCRLLGFKNKTRRRKSDYYNPVKTLKPNEMWCADVTIFKTSDNVKHYIHFLIDHYSKMILGYSVEKSASGLAITSLIKNACLEHLPKNLRFLTDVGSENVNTIVSTFIDLADISIEHIIAQKDVVFSNSMIEAVNKIIKHQFLHHEEINNGDQLTKIMRDTIFMYNTRRPQMSLGGNTPKETFDGLAIDISRYTHNFKDQQALRVKLNRKNICTVCS